MDLELDGRTAVVTGASKGIGLAITGALAAEGVQVVAGARAGSAELDALSEKYDVFPVQVDLTEPGGPGALIALAADRLGRLGILVNNVGAVRPRLDGFLALTDADWEWSWTINFLAAVRTMRAALPLLLQQPGANIVTVSSVNAFLPDPGVIDYSAAKGALSNVCKSLSKEFGGQVRVNTISPGPVETDLWLGVDGVAAAVSQASGASATDVAGDVAGQSATGRFTHPDEIADLVLFLAGGRAANITGSDFVIDGGLVTTL